VLPGDLNPRKSAQFTVYSPKTIQRLLTERCAMNEEAPVRTDRGFFICELRITLRMRAVSALNSRGCRHRPLDVAHIVSEQHRSPVTVPQVFCGELRPVLLRQERPNRPPKSVRSDLFEVFFEVFEVPGLLATNV
jgi:hypothetical protein